MSSEKSNPEVQGSDRESTTTQRRRRKVSLPVEVELSPTPKPPPAETAAPQPEAQRRTRRKKEVPVEVGDQVVEQPVAPAPTTKTDDPRPEPRRRTGRKKEAPVEVGAQVAEQPVAPAPTTEIPAPVAAEAPRPSRRRRGSRKPLFAEAVAAPVEEAPVEAPPVVAVEPVAEPTSSAKRRARRGRGRGRQADSESVVEPTEEPNQPPVLDLLDEELEPMPVLSWRKKPDAPEVKEAGGKAPDPTGEVEGPAPTVPAEGEPVSLRRSRTRKRKDRQGLEISAAAALLPQDRPTPESEAREAVKVRPERKAEPKRAKPAQPKEVEVAFTVPKPQPVKPVERPVIPTPADAPQVILIEGEPVLIRDRRVYPPVFFFASARDEAKLATVLDEVRMASDNGVHVISLLVELEVDKDRVREALSEARFLLKKVVEVDPRAQVVFRTVFSAPKDWEKRYPKARYKYRSGEWAEPSLSDDDFWGEAETCLKSFVAGLKALNEAGNIMGVHLERGEWFQADGAGYDTSPAATTRFRNWLRLRYRDDAVSLRAAWYDGKVSFDTAEVPELRNGKTAEAFVRTGRRSRPWVDYHLFLSDVTVERIERLAYTVKEASEGWFIAGVSYGYTFEWSHPASGHLSLGKLLRCRSVDYIAGPPSYRNREPGGTAAFPCPIDSFALNGKLYISEEDYKTPISGRQEPDDFNPVMKTPQALESVHWRGTGAALAHASGVCWMDTWGNGWLSSPGIWSRAKAARDAMTWQLEAPNAAPEVAVLVDERSLSYLADARAFDLLVQRVREAVLRSGASVGFYLLSDLAHRERFPESRLYVFLNAWDVRPEVRSSIKSKLQRDGKVLFWLYAAGLFEGGREALERAREVMGIALRPQPYAARSGTTLLAHRHPICQAIPERMLASGSGLEPSYFAIPEDGQVLGEYTQTGLPSLVVKHFPSEQGDGGWTSVFLGEPVVTPALFRALGQMAGAHVWNFQDDVVHVRSPFLTVHCTGAGQRTLTLPDKWSAYNLLTREWATVDSNHLKFHALDGSSHVFLVGQRSQVEAIVATPPPDPYILDTIPAQPENVVHWDSVMFDVPTMKLDEWVEEVWSEELADDLLLKPSMLDVDLSDEPESGRPSSSQSRGKRKRRIKRSGGEEGSAPSREAPEPAKADDTSINVVFRRRE